MPISPSRRAEIRRLVERLAGSLDDARSAAARLLVIGGPSVAALAEVARQEPPPAAPRAMRLLACLGDRRGPEVLAAIAATGDGPLPCLATELLAAFPEGGVVPILAQLACGGGKRPAALVVLHLLARNGRADASEAFSAALASGPPPLSPQELLASAEALERRLTALATDPLGDEPPEPPSQDPLDAYLELAPDAEAEVSRRKETAAGVIPEELAGRLEREQDPRRASLLALLATERPHPSLILPLRRVAQWAEEAASAADPEMAAASARAHLALALQASRVAAVELSRILELAPERIRVEHLGALELIGTRHDVARLAALSSRRDWLGDAAWRVLLQIAAREGLTARSPLLKGLAPERRLQLKPPKAAAKRRSKRP